MFNYRITAISTLLMMIATVFLAVVACQAKNTWKNELFLKKKGQIAIDVLKSIRDIEGLIINEDIYKINNIGFLHEPTYILKENEILLDCLSENIELISGVRQFCVNFIAKNPVNTKLSKLNEAEKNGLKENLTELKKQMKEMLKESIMPK